MSFQETRFPTITSPMFHLNRSQVQRRPDFAVCDSGRLFIPGEPSLDIVYLRDYQKHLKEAVTGQKEEDTAQEPQITEADRMAKFKAQGEAAEKA